MRKVISILLIVIGIICCGVAVYPLLEMNQQVNETLEEWESLKEEAMDFNEAKEESKIEGDIIGTLRLSIDEQVIPILMGMSDSILKRGIGLDEVTASIGTTGNSVLYGHRENILWNLKDISLGDKIYVETLEGTLTFSVSDMKVVDPEDDYIYEASEEVMITLVTCYPFIYMGPTPERYVVKAVLEIK